MEISVESLETPALTKAQLAELLFEQIGLNKRESKDMVDAFFDLIVDSLIQGQDVKISGFGNFQIRTKAARPGRNPLERPPPPGPRPRGGARRGDRGCGAVGFGSVGRTGTEVTRHVVPSIRRG